MNRGFFSIRQENQCLRITRIPTLTPILLDREFSQLTAGEAGEGLGGSDRAPEDRIREGKLGARDIDNRGIRNTLPVTKSRLPRYKLKIDCELDAPELILSLASSHVNKSMAFQLSRSLSPRHQRGGRSESGSQAPRFPDPPGRGEGSGFTAP